jgi:hypothetical protein
MDMTLRCEIFPADLDVTVDFYQRVLGFQLTDDRRDEDYISLRRGAVQVGAVTTGRPSTCTGWRGPGTLDTFSANERACDSTRSAK